MSFFNKVVIVTGAGSGIGEAVVLSFAKLSATLSLIDNNVKNLKNCSELCEKFSEAKVLYHVIDLQDDKSVKGAVEKTVQLFGKIDVVVNCAGIFRIEDGTIMSPNAMSAFDDTLAVNLRAVVYMTNCAAPMLINSKGCIINISSVAAVIPSPQSFAYNVSKSAVNHFTRCAALELASLGVRVNSISPGATKTNIFINAGRSQEQSDAGWEELKEMMPLKRIITAEEIAGLVVFLASDSARSITGSNYTVDSGLTLVGTYNLNQQ